MSRCLVSTMLLILLAPAVAIQSQPGLPPHDPAQSAPQPSASPQQSPQPALPAQSPQAAQSPVQSPDAPPSPTQPAQTVRPEDPAVDGQQPAQQPPSDTDYYKAIFQDPIPAGELEFLRQFDGAVSGEVADARQFRKLLKNLLPDCMFHYGHDMPLLEAMETVLGGSPRPVEIRDGRYFLIAGRSGPYLQGRGMLWIDLQDGIALGAFYFHPTNGEPTPAVNVFSRQVREEFLAMSELPPAFVQDLDRWSQESRVPQITARYFITGANKKILLEHDEDYCLTASQNVCQLMNSDAADVDMDAANYVEQTHHATNATAWMITGEDQRVFIGVRTRTCGDLLPCRVRLTRERVHVIIHRPPRTHVPHPGGSVHVGKH